MQTSKDFNSLPHTEVDAFEEEYIPNDITFQLTTSHRGRLLPKNLQQYIEDISTHYLTQR